MKANTLNLILLFTIFIAKNCMAEPWFSGPILASTGKVVPVGYIRYKLYQYDITNLGKFNRHSRLVQTTSKESKQLDLVLTTGIFQDYDFKVGIPYTENSTENAKSMGYGDIYAQLGYQAMTQGTSKYRPDLRIGLTEKFPTGRYTALDPTLNGADGRGAGSYQTQLSFNFQHLDEVMFSRYLRERLEITLNYFSKAFISRNNTYGGGTDTSGHVKNANMYSVDLSGELSLTQNFVVVMEAYYYYQGATRFRGTTGLDSKTRLPFLIGHEAADELSFAPAIQFNIAKHVGILGGYWFPVMGKDASDFKSVVFKINLLL